MKKKFIYYSAIWLITLAVFNILAFVVPPIQGYEKFNMNFWIGYALVTFTLIVQFVVTSLLIKKETPEKQFLKLAPMQWGYISLGISIVVGSICMAISIIPDWCAIVVCVPITAFYVTVILKAQIAIDEVERIGEKTTANMSFIKRAAIHAQCLITQARTDEAKMLMGKIYEALRYSEPVSNDGLLEIEKEISLKLSDLSIALNADDNKDISLHTTQILMLIDKRNQIKRR